MAILNYGSLNLDYVYQVPHFIRPGETLSSGAMECFAGGKGLNQSLALARAGAKVLHAGNVGEKDGAFLIETLEKSGVDTGLVRRQQMPSGHAIIQVTPEGENGILLFGGANQTVEEAHIREAFAALKPGELVLLQNEVNHLGLLIRLAHEAGLRVALNPSPMQSAILDLPLECVSLFLINEVEAGDLCGHRDAARMPEELSKRFPNADILLTLGSRGALFFGPSCPSPVYQPSFAVPVVDTTAAGDTFTGFFLAGCELGRSLEKSLELAAAAAALAVSRLGAAVSIPWLDGVEKVLPSLSLSTKRPEFV